MWNPNYKPRNDVETVILAKWSPPPENPTPETIEQYLTYMLGGKSVEDPGVEWLEKCKEILDTKAEATGVSVIS